MALTDEQRVAMLRFSLTAARSLHIANHSVDPQIVRGAKELAAFLLGVARTLDAIDPQERAIWEHNLDQALETNVVGLQQATGEPTFMDEAFLRHLESFSDKFSG